MSPGNSQWKALLAKPPHVDIIVIVSMSLVEYLNMLYQNWMMDNATASGTSVASLNSCKHLVRVF